MAPAFDYLRTPLPKLKAAARVAEPELTEAELAERKARQLERRRRKTARWLHGQQLNRERQRLVNELLNQSRECPTCGKQMTPDGLLADRPWLAVDESRGPFLTCRECHERITAECEQRARDMGRPLVFIGTESEAGE